MRFSLLTLILAVFCLGIGVLVLMRQYAWVPEPKVFTKEEFSALYPDVRNSLLQRVSPDGTRLAHWGNGGGGYIEDRRKSELGSIYYFGLRDYESPLALLLAELPYELKSRSDERPIHLMGGFLDDDRVVMIHDRQNDPTVPHFRIWRRMFPEWWWGHLYRPEVWALVVAVMALVGQVVREEKCRRSDLSGAKHR